MSTADQPPRRTAALALAFAPALVLALPAGAGAQPLSPRAQPSAIVESSDALALEAQEERRWFALSGALGAGRAPAGGTSDTARRWRAAGTVSALLAPPPLGAWRLSAALTNWSPAGAAEPPATVAPLATAGARLSRTLGRTAGVWGGWSEQRSLVAERRAASAPSYGLWKQFGGVLVSVGSSHHAARSSGRQLVPVERLRITPRSGPGGLPDTLQGSRAQFDTTRYTDYDTLQTSTRAHWADTEARLFWAHRRLSVESRLGARLTRSAVVSPTVWSDVEATLWLRPQWALVGTLGTRPARADLALGAQRFGGVALRLSPRTFRRTPLAPEIRPAASAFTLRRAGTQVVVSVLVPRARTVELSADFTGWRPLALRMSDAGRWEATVALPPGTYHVNLRVDGDRWTAPPGLVAVDDGFGGTAGVVVAQ